ncbi:MAG: HesA/MoeB/ThiF family protein, partial [Alphaproteobacteria bacterium]|nr:HesA/MoeB/ThiF family protein [Alphaproteobacteria bacterium]
GGGGLACPALLYLAAAGVGHIGILDFDMVDETNLQRQVLFTMDQLGRNKAEAARGRLQELNPGISIEAYPAELTEKNAEDFFRHYDVIIDGTDNFAAKYLINDMAVKCSKPFVYGSILGFSGQLSVFNLPGGPCYRCLFPEPPAEHVPSCAEAGVIGALAGMIGAAQAMEAMKIIVGHKDLQPLSGKIWITDTRSMEQRVFTLQKNPTCPVCSKAAENITPRYASPVCGLVREVTPAQARENKTALLIDVREREEWEAGHIGNSKLLPLSLLRQGHEPELPVDCEIILLCQRGKRGRMAAEILQALGYINVSNMTGGYEAWVEGEQDLI